jgi:hypothetical protein
MKRELDLDGWLAFLISIDDYEQGIHFLRSQLPSSISSQPLPTQMLAGKLPGSSTSSDAIPPPCCDEAIRKGKQSVHGKGKGKKAFICDTNSGKDSAVVAQSNKKTKHDNDKLQHSSKALTLVEVVVVVAHILLLDYIRKEKLNMTKSDKAPPYTKFINYIRNLDIHGFGISTTLCLDTDHILEMIVKLYRLPCDPLPKNLRATICCMRVHLRWILCFSTIPFCQLRSMEKISYLVHYFRVL